MIIYLDMDDVVADWHVLAQQILGITWDKTGERIPEEQWNRIKNTTRFYRDLPLMEGAHELVQWCRDAVSNGHADGLAFLTALPHDYSMPWAAYDKVFWAHKHFEGIPMFIGPFSHDKWRHCKPGDILIDDRHSNCSEWRAQGGLAHEYRNWAECKAWLEETFGN